MRACAYINILSLFFYFQCEAVIEEAEDHFIELFENDSSYKDLEAANDELIDEICVNRSKICENSVKDEL